MDERFVTEPLKGDYSRRTQRQRNQGMSKGMSIFSICVCLYDFLILVCGGGAIAFGVLLLQDTTDLLLTNVLVSLRFPQAMLLTLLAGCPLVVISIAGFIRPVRENKIVLTIIILILASLTAAFVVGAVFVFEEKEQPIATEITKETQHLHVSSLYGTNPTITSVWDRIQTKYECCGVSGDVNSTQSWAIYKLYSSWYAKSRTRTPYVPESCCSGNVTVCTGNVRGMFRGPPVLGPPVLQKYDSNPYLYTDGCHEKLEQSLKQYISRLAIVDAAVASVLSLGLVIKTVFCIMLCRRG